MKNKPAKLSRHSDPTANVSNQLSAAVKRIDDLRKMEAKCADKSEKSERRHAKELAELRDDFNRQLVAAEAKRIDAIRVVDVNAVSVANERAIAQAAILAKQVAESADALRTLVSTTAAAVAQQLQQMSQQFSDRLSQLERAQYEGAGKGAGMKDVIGWIFGAVMALLAAASYLVPRLK